MEIGIATRRKLAKVLAAHYARGNFVPAWCARIVDELDMRDVFQKTLASQATGRLRTLESRIKKLEELLEGREA